MNAKLPALGELRTLLGAYKYSDVFPRANDCFWSSSPYDGDSNIAWSVDFHYSSMDYTYSDYYYAVRLVSPNQSFESLEINSETCKKIGKFYCTENGIAFDPETGLAWERAAIGQIWDAKTQTVTGDLKVMSRYKAMKLYSSAQGESTTLAQFSSEEMLDEIDRLRYALTIAAKTFGEYAEIHANKTPPDENKVRRNANLCELCNEALAFTKRGEKL